jgi:phage-related protein
MTWSVTFFNRRVREETLGFPAGILANLLHILEMIEACGPDIGKPFTAPMGSGLFEIRAHGKEGIGRSLFCILGDREVVILASFVKKTRKTPVDIIELARKRRRELSHG